MSGGGTVPTRTRFLSPEHGYWPICIGSCIGLLRPPLYAMLVVYACTLCTGDYRCVLIPSCHLPYRGFTIRSRRERGGLRAGPHRSRSPIWAIGTSQSPDPLPLSFVSVSDPPLLSSTPSPRAARISAHTVSCPLDYLSFVASTTLTVLDASLKTDWLSSKLALTRSSPLTQYGNQVLWFGARQRGRQPKYVSLAFVMLRCMPNSPDAPCKFFQEDIVKRKDDPKAYGVVLVSPLSRRSGRMVTHWVWTWLEMLARCRRPPTRSR